MIKGRRDSEYGEGSRGSVGGEEEKGARAQLISRLKFSGASRSTNRGWGEMAPLLF